MSGDFAVEAMVISFLLFCLCSSLIPKKNGRFKTGYVDNQLPDSSTLFVGRLSGAVFAYSDYCLYVDSPLF
jgi:hypothetical protein